MQFNRGDKVKLKENYSRYKAGDIGVVTTGGASLMYVVMDRDNKTINGYTFRFEKIPPPFADDGRRFSIGTKVRFNQNYGLAKAGDTGVVDMASATSKDSRGITRVKLDDKKKKRKYVMCFAYRMDAIEEGENMPPEKPVVYHAFKVQDNGIEFKKLGDYTHTRTDLHATLFRDFGEGTYFYKVKNEKIGEIITISSPPKAYEVTTGFKSDYKDMRK